MRTLAFFLLLLTGCGQVWSRAIDQATTTNNTLVAALVEIQNAAKDQRKAKLDHVAATAPSVEAGRAEFDRIDAAYAPVWKALEKASLAQTALATVLEAAKVAQEPDVGEIMRLAGELQQLYAAVSRALAEVR